MTYQLCPHCGANREGMPDAVQCWRCKKLPTTAVESISPAAPAQQPPMAQGQARPAYNYQVFEQERYFIPAWLWLTGTLGILLLTGLLVAGAYLFVTADPAEEESSDTLSALDVQQGPPTGLPGASGLESVSDDDLPDLPSAPATSEADIPGSDTGNTETNTTDTFASEPASDVSSSASASSAADTGEPTPLPQPTLEPSSTPPPPVSPTPIVCPGTVLPQLVVGREAEVVSQNTIRVRDAAGLDTNIIVNIARGVRVTVTGEPICTGGFLWWPVSMVDGTTGWVAEGNNTQYFLEPR